MKRSYTYLKGLLTLALAAFTGWMWAAELVIPYTFDGKTGNTEYAYEYQVKMPSEALTSFTTTIRYAGGSHRVEILSVKLIDGETEYTAVATGTDGNEIADEGSYSGGNNYHNIFTFTYGEGFPANKVYTLQANLKVTDNPPSHNGNIKVSGGITLYVPPYSFGVNFTVGGDAISTTEGAGFTKGTYAKPTNWGNFTGSASGNGTITGENNTIKVYWTARGTWNSGTDKSTDESKLLHGYLDDTVNNGRTKATVTITGLPSDKQYAVALILSGDGANNTDFNGKFSPALINGQTYSYVDGVLVSGDAAKADNAKTWGDRSKAAAAAGLAEGTNVMFVEGLSGSILTITSAMDAQNTSRLTIAGVQVWTTEDALVAPAAPTDNEVISLNFYSEQGSVSGAAGLVSAQGWNNLAAGGTETTLAVWNGEEVVNYPISLTYSANNGYQYTGGVTDNYIKGYLDDGGSQAQVTVANIPFEEYSVIVYSATDTEARKFKPVLINGSYYAGVAVPTAYGYADLVLEGEKNLRSWGGSRNAVAAYGKNALRVDGLSGDLSITGGSNGDGARGGIAAIQIINTGAELSDDQIIDWTAVANPKASELPELTKPFVQLMLADGVTLEVDAAIAAGHFIEIVGNNVAVNITKIELGKADVEAIVSGAASVTTSYSETLGYTKDGVTYPLIFRGTTDANWATLSNWYIGTRTQGETTYWIPYTGTVIPGVPNSNEWRATLIDGELMAIAAGEDGYKTVTLPNTTHYEGWATKIAAYNGAHVVIGHANKFQTPSDGGFLRVDDTSKITFQAYSNGNSSGAKSIYVNAENGIVFAEGTTSGIQNMTYYFDGDGSVAFATLNQAQTIAGLVLDLGTAADGRKIVSRKLIGFTAGNATFTVAENAVTTAAEDVTLETADILQNVGQYKFEQKDDGYYVDYVAYAETDEIGAMNTWTKGEDANWDTAANWSAGFAPAEDATATIAITDDTTIVIPEAGVTVGTLVVSGEGTLTIEGGKITAAKIFAEANIAASETTLALAPMDIAEGKTVTYDATTVVADPDTVGGTSNDLALKAMTGAGTFVKTGAGALSLFATAAEPAIDVQEGAIYVREVPTTAMNIAAKAGTEIRLAAWQCNFNNSANSLKLEGGAQLTFANGANVSGTITIENATETAAKICGTSFTQEGTTISAAITGAGKVEFADGGAFGEGKYPCQYATTYSGVISGDLQVIVSDTSAVTFTGANTYTGGTVVATGATLTAPMRSGTPMEINGTLVVSYNASQVKLHENGADYSQITGTGKIRISNTANTNGWVSLPEDNKIFASTLALELEANHGLILTDADGAYTFGTLSGSKGFRVDWQNGERSVKILQAANSEHTGALIADYTAARLSKIVIAGATGATEKTLTLSGDTSVPARPMEIDATGSVNLTGAWGGDIDAYGKIAGTGTIGGKLKLQDGANLDVSAGALAVTGEVWVVNAATNTATVTLPDGYEVGMTIISCANAADVATDLSAKMPEGYRCVAENGAVKLAVAKVNVTIPAAPANTKWYDADGNEVGAGTIAVDPNADVTLTLKADEGYVFADGTNSTTVTVNAGETGAEIPVPEVEAAEAKAEANGVKYTSFAAAYATGAAEITLLADVTTPGFKIQKSVTIDLGGYTLSLTPPAVGSTGTETLGMQILPGTTVVINNGTINVAESNLTAEKPIKMMINNYSTALTLTGVTLDGTNLVKPTNSPVYTLSNNSGTVTIDAASTIIAKEGGIAFDVCKYASYAAPAVTVAEGATISGNVELTGGTLTAPAGLTVITSAGYKVVYADGEYTMVKKGAFEVNGTDYATLAEAYAAGDTITLTANAESAGIKIQKSVTIDLGGYTLSLTPPAVGSTGTETLGMQILPGTTVVINNGTINVAESNLTAEKPIKMMINNYSTALTLTGVTLDGTNLVKPTNSPVYTLSNNSGTVTIDAASTIIAKEGGIAFDVCKYASYAAPAVTVAEGATISGNVELTGGTLTAPAGLTVITSAGYKVVYADGKYTMVKDIVIEDVIAATPAAEAIKAAMAEKGVTEIESYTITTKGAADTGAEADEVAAVLEVFEVTPTVDANGVLTVAYEFGISSVTNVGEVITITAGVTGAEYRAGVEVAFYADGVEIGTATTTADSTTVSITNIQATAINGKKITVKAIK